MAYPRYRHHLLGRSRELKRHSTRCEIILWTRLRKKQLGFRFRRQRPIGLYIADFYCSELKLVIEVDGASHEDRTEYDAARDLYMRAMGIEVIRFSDFKVDFDEETVVTEIELALVRRAKDLGVRGDSSKD
jgi:very-short-patch-repair endonuclease